MDKLTNSKMLRILLLAVLLLGTLGVMSAAEIAAPQEPSMKFTHPGLLNSKSELDFVKTKIKAGAEPWSSLFNSVKKSSYGSLNWTPHPLVVVHANGKEAGIENEDAKAAYAQALLWYFSDNGDYARKSVEILNAWSGKLTNHVSTDQQNAVQAAWCGSIFPLAGEILRSSYLAWSGIEIKQFSAMLNRAFLPLVLPGNATFNGNWELSMSDALMVIGVFNDDAATFERGVFLWRKRVPAYFYMTTDGPTPIRPYGTTNLESNTAIYNHWFKPSQYFDGLFQETRRDYGHHMQMGLASAINAAEIAFHQGIDLYAENDHRLMAAMEFQAGPLSGKPVPKSLFPDGFPASDVLPTWEIAFNHFHNRKGFALPLTETLIHARVRGSDFTAMCNLAWESLTHAEVAPADMAQASFAGRSDLSPAAKVWPSDIPAGCPIANSSAFAGLGFTGRYVNHGNADTWYPSWGADGRLYSPFTDGTVDQARADGAVEKIKSRSAGDKAVVDHAVIEGGDVLNLKVVEPGVIAASPAPYEGRYPCACLHYNGIWYIGTYALANPPYGLNWPILGPFAGFHISKDNGKTWEKSPWGCEPEKTMFPEPAHFKGPLKLGVPHVVDFGRNMENSPDAKMYLVCHGATQPDEADRKANLSWITGDQIYLCRVTPSPDTVNDAASYEYFGGHDGGGKPVWSKEYQQLQPLLDWDNHCGGVTITFDKPLNKYLMCVTDGHTTESRYDTYILESDRITGPWKLVTYMKDFGTEAYFVNIPSKFISGDGRTFWLCYSANWMNVAKKREVHPANPPGSSYTMSLHEARLLDAKEAKSIPTMPRSESAASSAQEADASHPSAAKSH